MRESKMFLLIFSVLSSVSLVQTGPASAALKMTFKAGSPGEAVLEAKDQTQQHREIFLQKLEDLPCVEFSENETLVFKVCQVQGSFVIEQGSEKADLEVSQENWKETSFGSKSSITWQQGHTFRVITKKTTSEAIDFIEGDEVLAHVDLNQKNPRMIVFNPASGRQKLPSFSFWLSLWSPYLLQEGSLEATSSNETPTAPFLPSDSSTSIHNQSSSALSTMRVAAGVVGSASVLSLGCYVLYRAWKSQMSPQWQASYFFEGDAKSEFVLRARIENFLKNYKRMRGRGGSLGSVTEWIPTGEPTVNEGRPSQFGSWQAQVIHWSSAGHRESYVVQVAMSNQTVRISIEGHPKVRGILTLTDCPFEAQMVLQILRDGLESPHFLF